MNSLFLIRSAKAVLMFALLAGIALPSLSIAAPAYVTFIGPDGQILGDVAIAGKEGTVQVEDYSHNVSAAYDDTTGLLTGSKQHRPVRLVVLVDQAVPTLFDVMSNGYSLPSVTVNFYHSDGGGETNYSRVVLNNAHIVSMIPHKSEATDAMLETISLSYESITISDGENNSHTATDTWGTP